MKEYEDLIKELESNREGNYKILEQISSFRDKLETLLPSGNDYRSKHIMESKMKTFTEIIKAELDVRKSIDSSIKSQVEIKGKVEKKDVDDNNISHSDIKNIVTMLEKKKN